MTQIQKWLHWLGAIGAASAAVALLIAGGLPERAEFSGQFIPELGLVAPEPDALAPPFEGILLDDTPLDLLSLRGELVILNFWATWCEPCIDEMPILQAVYDDYGDDGLMLLGVNLGESADVIQDWLTTHRLDFPIVLDENLEIAQLYRLRGQPSTVIIDADGRIARIIYGPVDEMGLRRTINRLLEETRS